MFCRLKDFRRIATRYDKLRGRYHATVTIASIMGYVANPKAPAYAASKAAVVNLTRALASRWAADGIRVNAVAPGPVWTPLNPADRPADKVADFGKDSDMGRPAQPEEMSPAYVFLASKVCASYVNGVILPAMGGPRG